MVPETLLTRAKYPFVDVHNHQFDMPLKDLSKLTMEMDRLNMGFMVNLSGFRGLYLQQSLKNVQENAPTRFGLFLNIDFEAIDEADFAVKNIELIQKAVADGVIGLKVYKSLGLTDRDRDGNRIAVDDTRLDPIWKACGDNGIPVLIHSGEPASFWAPKTVLTSVGWSCVKNPVAIEIHRSTPLLKKYWRNSTIFLKNTLTPHLLTHIWAGWAAI